MALPLGALTGGDGPLGAVNGLAGGGGPLDSVSGLAGGLGGDGGPLGAVSGLAGGLGGDDGPLGAVSGLAGGLLGGGQGLNVAGLVGLGSDDDALLDLAPAEKKKVKAQKAVIAKQNEDKRKAAMQKLRDQVKKQGHPPTAEQLEAVKRLNESQMADDQEMQKLDAKLGPTDPDLYQQALSSANSGEASGSSTGLFYAYLVNGQTYQPTHLLTFPNASAAQQWSQSADAVKAGDQMYVYDGTVSKPSGKMGFMPINTVQPIIPLQRGDGFPICCKSGSSSSSQQSSFSQGASGTGLAASQQPTAYIPPKPARKPLTFQNAAEAHADNAIARGDTRPKDQIVQEAMDDLKANCAAVNGCQGQPTSNTTAAAPGPLGGLTDPAGGPLGGVTGAAGGALGGVTGAAGGDPLGGLLGGGEGLNVAGLVGLGSDDKALLDLAPAEKKEVKQNKKKMLQQQQQIQAQQLDALKKQIAANNGRQTAQQQQQLKELEQRRQASNQAINAIDKSVAEDDAKAGGLTQGLPTNGLTQGLPTNGLTQGLPTNGLTQGLPTSGLTGALPTKSLPLGGL